MGQVISQTFALSLDNAIEGVNPFGPSANSPTLQELLPAKMQICVPANKRKEGDDSCTLPGILEASWSLAALPVYMQIASVLWAEN